MRDAWMLTTRNFLLLATCRSSCRPWIDLIIIIIRTNYLLMITMIVNYCLQLATTS
jgi:hypothetical protein